MRTFLATLALAALAFVPVSAADAVDDLAGSCQAAPDLRLTCPRTQDVGHACGVAGESARDVCFRTATLAVGAIDGAPVHLAVYDRCVEAWQETNGHHGLQREDRRPDGPAPDTLLARDCQARYLVAVVDSIVDVVEKELGRK